MTALPRGRAVTARFEHAAHHVAVVREGAQSAQFAVARMVAASVFSEFFVRWSATLECSTTSREGRGGRPNFAPTSMLPGGATRRPSAATARPADTAAPVVVMPPPTNT